MNDTFINTRYSAIFPFSSTITSKSLIQADFTFWSVRLQRWMPSLMASSKLLDDDTLISVTFARLMVFLLIEMEKEVYSYNTNKKRIIHPYQHFGGGNQLWRVGEFFCRFNMRRLDLLLVNEQTKNCYSYLILFFVVAMSVSFISALRNGTSRSGNNSHLSENMVDSPSFKLIVGPKASNSAKFLPQ